MPTILVQFVFGPNVPKLIAETIANPNHFFYEFKILLNSENANCRSKIRNELKTPSNFPMVFVSIDQSGY